MSVQVSAPIDEATMQKFDKVCQSIGVSPSNAIGILITGVINNNGIPLNEVIPPSKPTSTKMTMAEAMGCMRGQITMSDDFDAPLEDFKEYME
jgi:addiction module RelB/DinJ family antitoxin